MAGLSALSFVLNDRTKGCRYHPYRKFRDTVVYVNKEASQLEMLQLIINYCLINHLFIQHTPQLILQLRQTLLCDR
jgi:hypothetical protein